jgi:hypothetical protein
MSNPKYAIKFQREISSQSKAIKKDKNKSKKLSLPRLPARKDNISLEEGEEDPDVPLLV